MQVDWSIIKTEYVTDQTTSYRKLAKKYGVSATSVYAKGRDEDWTGERKRHLDKCYAKTLSGLSKGQEQRAIRLQTLADKLLDKIEKAIDDFEVQELMTDKSALRQITGALKDIKEVQMIKSKGDILEQDARIAKLRKEAEEDKQTDNTVHVVIDSAMEEYAE